MVLHDVCAVCTPASKQSYDTLVYSFDERLAQRQRPFPDAMCIYVYNKYVVTSFFGGVKEGRSPERC